jgi:hypothetical protein
LGFAPEGIGEARHADFGITGANGSGIIYAKSEPLKKIPTEDLVEEVFAEIGKYYAAGAKVIGDDAHSAEAAHWLSEDEDDLMGPTAAPARLGPRPAPSPIEICCRLLPVGTAPPPKRKREPEGFVSSGQTQE